MSVKNRQAFWAPGGATIRLPPTMCLAKQSKERLWMGLERFANCGDSEADYRALSRAFRDFWPVAITLDSSENLNCAESVIRALQHDRPLVRVAPIKPIESEASDEVKLLDWHRAARPLFVFYRNTLRNAWRNDVKSDWPGGGRLEFLLGLSDFNQLARHEAKTNPEFPFRFLILPLELFHAWKDILNEFPSAVPDSPLKMSMLPGTGEFFLYPYNDFQRAFYLLYRQSWRARVCPRCELFFIARRSIQKFCGTACSSGSRLASKRRWWKAVGEGKRRNKAHSRRQRERKP
jgi:hypothetical protein